MFHAFLAPFLFILSLLSPHPHVSVIDKAQASIVRITGTEKVETWLGTYDVEYVCSGEVINLDTVLTANHCVSKGMLVDGEKITAIVKQDEYYDLGLVTVKTKKPIITLRDAPVERYEALTAIGYAEGFSRLTSLEVSARLVDYSPDIKEIAPGIFVTPSYIGGMSGGPVIDVYGEMVSMVQQRTEGGLGYGVGTLIIRAFLL